MLYPKFYRYSDMETLKQLYVAFIHPNLEYATAVWDPHLSKDVQKLESVQCFACRVCTKRWNDAYSDMLHTLNIPPLSDHERRNVSFVQDCHWFHWLPECTPSVQALHKSLPQIHTSSHSSTTPNSFCFSFFSHAVAVWNTLPFSVVSSNNISMFKNSFVSL